MPSLNHLLVLAVSSLVGTTLATPVINGHIEHTNPMGPLNTALKSTCGVPITASQLAVGNYVRLPMGPYDHDNHCGKQMRILKPFVATATVLDVCRYGDGNDPTCGLLGSQPLLNDLKNAGGGVVTWALA